MKIAHKILSHFLDDVIYYTFHLSGKYVPHIRVQYNELQSGAKKLTIWPFTSLSLQWLRLFEYN